MVHLRLALRMVCCRGPTPLMAYSLHCWHSRSNFLQNQGGAIHVVGFGRGDGRCGPPGDQQVADKGHQSEDNAFEPEAEAAASAAATAAAAIKSVTVLQYGKQLLRSYATTNGNARQTRLRLAG